MTTERRYPQPVINTDREIWRATPGDYYSDSVFVTEGGGIGIQVGGRVVVRSPADWVAAFWKPEYNRPEPREEHDCHECEGDGIILGQKCAECGGSGKRQPREEKAADDARTPPRDSEGRAESVKVGLRRQPSDPPASEKEVMPTESIECVSGSLSRTTDVSSAGISVMPHREEMMPAPEKADEFEEAVNEMRMAAGGLGAYDDYYYGGAETQRAAEKEFDEAVKKMCEAHRRALSERERETWAKAAAALRENLAQNIVLNQKRMAEEFERRAALDKPA